MSTSPPPAVRRRPLGKTGLSVSEIGFGALEIGRDWAADVNPAGADRHLSADEAARVLNAVLDLGVNLVDTAPAYWHSEEFIGRALASRRDEYVLATKVGEACDRETGSIYDYSGKATLDFIDRSLKRLRTDRIDLLQIHSASMEVLEKGETLAAMQEAQRAGKALHLGMTGGVAEAVRAIELGGYSSVQVPYNLLNLEAEQILLLLAEARGVAVLIMRPLAGGKLSAKFKSHESEAIRGAIQPLSDEATAIPGFASQSDPLASASIGYLLAQPAVTSLLVGTRRVEAVRANIAAARESLPVDAAARLRATALQHPVETW